MVKREVRNEKVSESQLMQIKSKERVCNHGEVFTHEREVKAMLNMVNSQAGSAENEEKRILEPACGEGIFLQEVLRRRLAKLALKHKHAQIDYEFHALIALGSLYGIDILKDNAETCRVILLNIFTLSYKKCFKKKMKADCINAARFILEQNIIWGDACTMKRKTEAENEGKEEPIRFSQWQPIPPYKLNKQDYIFSDFLADSLREEGTLFASDTGEAAIIPKALGEEYRDYLAWGRGAQAHEPEQKQGQRELF